MNAQAIKLTDLTSAADAYRYFSHDQLWQLFDGDRDALNIAHECIDRHIDKGAAMTIVRDGAAPPLFSKVVDFGGNIDRYQFVRFEPPCYIWIDARAVPTGTNDFDKGLQWVVMNALTPETDDTMHYFWGLSRHFAQDDEDMTRDIHEALIRTFEEDSGVLKIQHELIQSDAPGAMGNNINADRGITLAHHLVDELMAVEQAGA